jgi:hypothetical protein
LGIEVALECGGLPPLWLPKLASAGGWEQAPSIESGSKLPQSKEMDSFF